MTEQVDRGAGGEAPLVDRRKKPRRAVASRKPGAGSRRGSPLADLVESMFGRDLPVALEFYDGGRLGPPDAPATVEVRSRDALSRILTAPGELGFARAYVAGDIELVGDIYAALELRHNFRHPRLSPGEWISALRSVGVGALRPLPAPAEEARQQGRLHSLQRDAQSISVHYDVSNDFYENVLGPAMTYSCALFTDPGASLEAAQWSKLELVSSKLALAPGMRLLDVGCGWGSMAIHAARHHGAAVVGITLSVEQAEGARERVAAAGLSHLIDIRVQDYRHLQGETFDAISSIGMSEHVGDRELPQYFKTLRKLLVDDGRLLNHAITRPAGESSAIGKRTFMSRYVFPDAALEEMGEVVTAMQLAGFEARHAEGLREHYARTLREWVRNLESNWEHCVAEVGLARARIWRLYMAGTALGFEDGRLGIAQILGTPVGSARFPRRPDWNPHPVAPSDPFAVKGTVASEANQAESRAGRRATD